MDHTATGDTGQGSPLFPRLLASVVLCARQIPRLEEQTLEPFGLVSPDRRSVVGHTLAVVLTGDETLDRRGFTVLAFPARVVRETVAQIVSEILGHRVGQALADAIGAFRPSPGARLALYVDDAELIVGQVDLTAIVGGGGAP